MSRALAFALVLAAGPARATVCPAPLGADMQLERIEGEVRLAYVEGSIEKAARASKIYTGVWVSFLGAELVINAAVLGNASPDDRIDRYVAITTTSIGILSFAFNFLPSITDARRLRRLGGDTCARLREAEKMLERDAAAEKFGKSVLKHAGTFAVNIAAGLVLGIAWSHWDQAALQSLLGIAIGEAIILTQPDHASRAYNHYRAGELVALKRWRPSLTVAPMQIGMAVGVSF